MTWGHSTSKDLLHWEHQPLALQVDANGAIFSGSCVVDKNNTAGFGENAVVAFYTTAGECQTQSMAYSLDGGKTFTKYAGNPIIVAGIPDFRDPKVWWNEATSEWNMALACGQEMQFYASKNLKEWAYLSSFGEGVGNHGGVWECPDMLRVKVRGTNDYKWVLLCNINPGGPFGGSATQYFVGEWDGKTFTPASDNGEVLTKWMDYGKDHYATVSFAHAPQERTTVMVWMSNWQYANDVPTTQFRSANALPRDIDLFRDSEGIYRIGVKASPEVAALKGKVLGKGTTVKTVPATAVIEVEVNSSKRPATITLSNENGEKVTMTYDFQAGTFSMDRNESGIKDFSRDFAAKTTTHSMLKPRSTK
jgi:levanase/fructan beta-fructosidase